MSPFFCATSALPSLPALPAILATCCFAFSVIFAARSSRIVGGAAANLGRMIAALIFLAIWAHVFGEGLAEKKSSFAWFFVSGVIGFGIGDIAMFLALTRIGPRLTILLVQCLAAPFGVLIERVWLGTRLSGAQLFCGAVILLGVAIALAPQRDLWHSETHRRAFWPGVFFGALEGLGQALGAVISRKASVLAALGGLRIDGGTAAYQRMLGGILVTALFFLATRHAARAQRETHARADEKRVDEKSARHFFPKPATSALPWMIFNALAGPVIGVGCYQWALATMPSGIVLPIVAATPVAAIPLAYFFENDHPSRRSIFGGVIAVAGVIALTRV